MKIYIAVDLEGISGVFRWAQVKDMTNLDYQEARRLMMADIDAVIDGCLAGGAKEIIVRDGHHGGINVIPELMNPKATYYICGYQKGMPVLMGLDENINGLILLGYHAMAGTKDGVLRHTQSSASGRRYFYNDREFGEIGQHALMAGHFGVPVIMVSGDDATCREAKDFLGENIITTSTKKGYGEEYARLFPPSNVHKELTNAVEKAVRNNGSFKPFTLPLPIAGRLSFPKKETADSYKKKSEQTRRIDDFGFERIFNENKDILEF